MISFLISQFNLLTGRLSTRLLLLLFLVDPSSTLLQITEFLVGLLDLHKLAVGRLLLLGAALDLVRVELLGQLPVLRPDFILMSSVFKTMCNDLNLNT